MEQRSATKERTNAEELAEEKTGKEVPIFHTPYYSARRLEEGEEKKEEVKEYLKRYARSCFVEITDGKPATTDTPVAYAELTIFDGKKESGVIPLEIGGSFSYDFWDDIWIEWIKIRAVNGWIRYRLHATPGLRYLLVEAAK